MSLTANSRLPIKSGAPIHSRATADHGAARCAARSTTATAARQRPASPNKGPRLLPTPPATPPARREDLQLARHVGDEVHKGLSGAPSLSLTSHVRRQRQKESRARDRQCGTALYEAAQRSRGGRRLIAPAPPSGAATWRADPGIHPPQTDQRQTGGRQQKRAEQIVQRKGERRDQRNTSRAGPAQGGALPAAAPDSNRPTPRQSSPAGTCATPGCTRPAPG